MEDLQKLLELANQTPNPGDEKELSEAERFVVSVGIKEGTKKVSCLHIYDLYKQWTNKPIYRRLFFVQFAKIFKKCRHGTMRFYRLDPAPFDFSKDNYFRLRREWRDYKEKNRRAKQKANKEKQSKVSGPDAGSES